ncbi:uncharacterized protein LOC128377748 [Scomber japonicus]|uniref:uncharacterized protein LOC128377748 n=1 Tax=Scomber japonicus TaxID=13676 RepID=UPI00230676E6|nr:uncharacterized protein LOC128377748 [Scomber japonicus]
MVNIVELLNTLKDLTEEEFEEFKWHLKHGSLAGYQTIKESQLENAERQDIVGLMVKTYQLPGAVEATKKLLKMINRNDLLQSLSDISSRPEDKINDKESSENRGPSPFQPLTDNSQSEDTSRATKRKVLKFCQVPLMVLVVLVVLAVLTFILLLALTDGTGGSGVALPELKRVQQYAVDVTLDPDTANPKLILSADGKQVNYGDVKKNLTDNPERFTRYVIVLGKQSFSSGRFYFEVQVKEKTKWDLGVAKESIDRKGEITLSPEDGFWTIVLRNGNEYKGCNSPPVRLSLKSQPQKVGVFVDYEEGLVSFYDVDAAALIYSFTGCSFTEKLYPYFGPGTNDGGKNSAPLIICPGGMVKKVELLNTLKDLTEEEFEEFKWHLKDESLAGYQTIKASQLENAERQDIVDLMVKTYQLPGAVEATKKLLKTINRNDLLQKVPCDNREDRMCMKHNKPLELFCKTDQKFVCKLCSDLDHKTHDVVPLKEEYKRQKTKLRKTQVEIQEIIDEKQLKIEEIKHSVDLSKEAADREKAEGVQVFTALKESVERSLNELIETIEEKQRTTEKQAEDFIKELKQEISELKKRSSEVEKLSHSEDHLQFLRNVLSLKAPPPTKDWKEVSVRPSSYKETAVRAVSQLEETLSKQMKKLLAELELKRVQQYAVDVTLDPDTAHPKLILSDDGKQVHHGDVKKNLPDNPERFSDFFSLLGKQFLSSGRFYFEVQVKEKTDWDLGVARESINRKGDTTARPQDGFWTIWLRNGHEYKALDDPPVYLSLESQPQKVGVFVDYEEGLVSFYDVDAAALIYSFSGCSFTEKLYPYFGPGPNYGGTNSAPLIIFPVNQTG